MENLQIGKINKTLSEVFRYKEGVMTRRENIERLQASGGRIEVAQRRNYAKEEKEEAYVKRNAFNIPFGNDKHPLTVAYNNRKQALKEGYFITEYRAYRSGEECFYIVTKTEFEYFNSL